MSTITDRLNVPRDSTFKEIRNSLILIKQAIEGGGPEPSPSSPGVAIDTISIEEVTAELIT